MVYQREKFSEKHICSLQLAGYKLGMDSHARLSNFIESVRKRSKLRDAESHNFGSIIAKFTRLPGKQRFIDSEFADGSRLLADRRSVDGIKQTSKPFSRVCK